MKHEHICADFGRQTVVRFLTASFVSALICYAIRLSVASRGDGLATLSLTALFTLLASLLGLMLMVGFNRYPGTRSYSATFSALTVAYGFTMAILLIARLDYARGMLFGCFFLTVVLTFVQQIIWPAREQLKIAIIPSSEAGQFPNLPVEVIELSHPSDGIKGVDAVTVDFRKDLSEEWQRRIVELALQKVPIFHIKHLHESLTGRVELEHLSETSYGTLSPPIGYIIIKRLVDSLIAFIFLILLSPLMLLIGFAIKLETPGPAIFRQRRVGFSGRVFVVHKFRTMHHAMPAEEPVQAAITKEGDCRITSLGRFLRKSRLDELPQLINVLRGEMSLIGPRPEAEVLSRIYEIEIPFYRYRHVVLPGVTGWAQINQGHVTDIGDISHKLHYDFYYIKHLSPWLDFLIALRTILVMFNGHGAR